MYMAKEKFTKPCVMTTQPMPAAPIYRLDQAATILDCNERILAEKFRKGVIPAKKKLGKWYTLHSNLVSFINS